MERNLEIRHVDTESMHFRLAWFVLVGLVVIVVGLVALYAPYYSAFPLRALIGSYFLVCGAMFLGYALWTRHEGGFIPKVSIGVLYLVFAVLAYATGEVRTLTMCLVLFFALEGLLKILLAVGLRPRPEWVWGLTGAIVSFVVCLAVWWVVPGTALVSVMVGLDLIHTGSGTLMVGRSMRRTLERGEPLCMAEVCFSD